MTKAPAERDLTITVGRAAFSGAPTPVLCAFMMACAVAVAALLVLRDYPAALSSLFVKALQLGTSVQP